MAGLKQHFVSTPNLSRQQTLELGPHRVINNTSEDEATPFSKTLFMPFHKKTQTHCVHSKSGNDYAIFEGAGTSFGELQTHLCIYMGLQYVP